MQLAAKHQHKIRKYNCKSVKMDYLSKIDNFRALRQLFVAPASPNHLEELCLRIFFFLSIRGIKL
jgi:hypothetical protein